jgi:hypothetical protein
VKILNEIIDTLQEKFPINRIATLLTPVFAAVAGWVATWIAENFPYLESMGFNETQILGFFITGAVAALGIAYKWLDGWQKDQQQEHEKVLARMGVGVGGTPFDHPESADVHPDDAEPELNDLDSEKAKAAEAEKISRAGKRK